MKRKIIILISLFFVLGVHAQESRIFLDEIYSDWTDNEIVHSDAIGDQNSGSIDFGKLWYKNDERFIFFRIEVGDEINLQDLNDITLYLDTDKNSSTGLNVHGIGAELEYNFGDRGGKVRVSGFTINVGHEDIGLVSSPTVTSDQFEIAIRRDVSFNGLPLFPQTDFNAAMIDNGAGGDKLPNETGGITLNMPNYVYEPLPQFSISKLDESYLRVLTYNVEQDGFFSPSKMPSFERLLKAAKPAIIGFEEIYDHTSQQTAARVEEILPSSAGEQWYHAKQGSDNIVISRYPIIGTHQIDQNGAFLIDLRPANDSDLLFVVAHTPCCDNNVTRQMEIDAIMAYVRDAKAGGTSMPIAENTPIVIVGDMNLVGFAQQQTTLITGDIFYENNYGPDFNPDWDDTSLEDAKPFTTGMPMTFTWYDEGSSFSPGRLDYIVYSGSVLEIKNSFAFFTKGLSSDSLSAYNLLPGDSQFAADHIPVVADFEFKELTGVEQTSIPSGFNLYQNYPNPFNPTTKIKFTVPLFTHPSIPSREGKERSDRGVSVTLIVYDILGEKIATLVNEPKKPGTYEVEFYAHNLPSGIYYYRLVAGDFNDTKKFVLIK